MKNTATSLTAIVIIAFLVSCKDLFQPELSRMDAGYLVVDGYINVRPDAITQITLSRTTPINEVAAFTAVEGAMVSVEDEDGNAVSLTEVLPGKYESEKLNLSQTRSYRLKILTDEKAYYSEFVEPIATPEIDSVSWEEVAEGIQIYVSTHDPENKTKYYQWSYSEVWERTVPYVSYYKFENGQLILRSRAEILAMQTCWKYLNSIDINTQSAEKYVNDMIPMNHVLLIPKHHERLNVRYSVEVQQHALSKNAFTFFEILKKNGRMGTFSDPLPSQLPGNLYRLGSPEPVVGYTGAYMTQTLRIEILPSQLEAGWFIPPVCNEDSVALEVIGLLSNSYLPTQRWGMGAGAFITPIYCADCRVNGGTNIRPSFWPN